MEKTTVDKILGSNRKAILPFDRRLELSEDIEHYAGVSPQFENRSIMTSVNPYVTTGPKPSTDI